MFHKVREKLLDFKNFYLTSQKFIAIHNKDYSVVKTFKAAFGSPVFYYCGDTFPFDVRRIFRTFVRVG